MKKTIKKKSPTNSKVGKIYKPKVSPKKKKGFSIGVCDWEIYSG